MSTSAFSSSGSDVRHLVCFGAFVATAMVPAQAQEDRLAELERRLAEQQQRIEQLETALAARAPAPDAASPVTAVVPVTGQASAPLAPPALALKPETTPHISGLDVGGDFRVRGEWNFGGPRGRSRSAVRARLRAAYAVDRDLTLGARLVTGDPDDPNSSDVTLGNFADDFAVALDQAWIGYRHGRLSAYAGKFPQIFQRTDMLWDGDVSPQGVGAEYHLPIGSGALDGRLLWFVIDEAAVARDSDMLGGQLSFSAPLSPSVAISTSGSYYHYRLGSVAGADQGDFRGNLMAGGRYLSDFHILEWLGSIRWAAFGEKWPLALSIDYARNLGAAVPADQAFNVDLSAGRATAPGDWRLAYNYSEVETDAVFTAFSHDNIDLASNYRLHGVGLSHIPAPNLQLDLLWYHFRQLDAAYAGPAASREWLDRIRLSLMVSF